MPDTLSEDEIKAFEDYMDVTEELPSDYWESLSYKDILPVQIRDIYERHIVKKGRRYVTVDKTGLENELKDIGVPNTWLFRGLYIDYLKGRPVRLLDTSSFISAYKQVHRIAEEHGVSIRTVFKWFKEWLKKPTPRWRVYEYRFYAVRRESTNHTPDRQLEVIMLTAADQNQFDKVYPKSEVIIEAFLKSIQYDFLLDYKNQGEESNAEVFITQAQVFEENLHENWQIKYGARWLEEIDEPESYVNFTVQLNDYEYNTVRYRSVFRKPKKWWELRDDTLRNNVISHKKKIRENLNDEDVSKYIEERIEWLNKGQPTLWHWMR